MNVFELDLRDDCGKGVSLPLCDSQEKRVLQYYRSPIISGSLEGWL